MPRSLLCNWDFLNRNKMEYKYQSSYRVSLDQCGLNVRVEIRSVKVRDGVSVLDGFDFGCEEKGMINRKSWICDLII